MKLKQKSESIHKLLEYKSNDYKRKYFILSSLFETNIKDNNRLYEEFNCYVNSLNYSNGKYPDENSLTNFYKECLSYDNYSNAVIKEKSNFIKNYNQLKNPKLYLEIEKTLTIILKGVGKKIKI